MEGPGPQHFLHLERLGERKSAVPLAVEKGGVGPAQAEEEADDLFYVCGGGGGVCVGGGFLCVFVMKSRGWGVGGDEFILWV